MQENTGIQDTFSLLDALAFGVFYSWQGIYFLLDNLI